LVARALEHLWEEALRQEPHAQKAYARFQREQPAELTPSEREAIRRLAQDVPGLWGAPETSAQDRQEMVRLVIERLTIDIQGESEQVEITLHWAGGVCSGHHVIRPVARYDHLSHYQALIDRIDTLRRDGFSLAPMAERLNRDGFDPPKRTDRFSGSMVARLLSPRGLHGPRPRAMADATVLHPHEYWLTEVARRLNMPIATLHKWQRLGWVSSRKVAVGGGRWALWADADELERLGRLRAYKRQSPTLTTPKRRDPEQGA
jgi:DNA-binding transcriptional MerR regulator